MGRPFSVAILTVSDRCARGETPDTSGPALAEIVAHELGTVVASACVPDEIDAIRDQLRSWSAQTPALDLVLTTGGTGLAPRDVTPEATLPVLERRHPGLLELARLRCYPGTPRAFLSRGKAGTRGRTLIVNLPGSRSGSTECLRALLDVLPHALATLRGDEGHDDERGAPGRAPGDFSHLDEQGRARMVDVSAKDVTRRRAVAEGRVRVSAELAANIAANTVAKGNLLEVARLAGVQAAKQTSALIPLCHNLALDFVNVEAWLKDAHVWLRAEVRSEGKTGVEMEALTAVAVAALTVIDMGKAVDRAMVIEEIRLVEKTGGRHTGRVV